jgi:hypothetical protein
MKHKTLAGFLRNHPKSNGRIKSWLQRENELGRMPLSEFANDFTPSQLLKFRGIGKKTCDDIASIFKADKLISDSDFEIENLPGRIKTVLLREGLKTRKAIRKAICQGKLHPRRIRNYGLSSHKVLCVWTRTNNLEIENLPEKVKYVLLSVGLITRKAVKNAIDQGELHPGKIRNYGWESHRLLCQWVRTN